VYKSISRWDPEKKQSRATRELIGKIDKETGEMVPTDGRGKRRGMKKREAEMEAICKSNASRRFYGATYLLQAIGDSLGVTEDLKRCFPDTYKQMLSIVYYMILEDNNPLFRFGKWGRLHWHPYGEEISSQRSSELFASVTEEAKEKFFRLQGLRKADNEYWAYDTTSISSYSEQLEQVRYGKRKKESDALPQLNLALVFGEKSNLPFYYRELAGNIQDSQTVKKLLADLDSYGFSKVKLTMDRGFYSEANINSLYKSHKKFLAGVKMNVLFIQEKFEKVGDSLRTFENYDDNYELYAKTVSALWHYKDVGPRKGRECDCKRIYIHYYYNVEKAAEEEKALNRKLSKLRMELESGKRKPENERKYTKWFEIHTTPKRGTRVTVREDLVKKAQKNHGFFALLSNEKMDPIAALEIYRNKDLVEKAFGNLKERLNLRRTLVSSEESLRGKLFVTFVSLIYLSYIKKKMQDNNLFKTYTLQGALDELDVIECFEHAGKRLVVGEMLEKQNDLYQALGVTPPPSL
jgi:transposase